MIIVGTLKQVHHEILENTYEHASDADPNNWSWVLFIIRQNGSTRYS